MARGQLRIYLGAAPGVGKTVAMLDEAHRRLARGTDVVVGFVETHGRSHTAHMVHGLEVVPRRTVTHRGTTLEELDTAAVIARRPRVVLVDELAHTNAPGSPHEKRWQDVDEILDAGIDVLSTVNIQHLESLNDVTHSITGVRQRETVPDQVVRRAEQVELVDMTPEALRRRMAHGNVYRPEKVDAALANYFRVGNLSALRELALLWLADRVDEALERYRADQGIAAPWPTRERVVVALSGGPEGETLLRRGARIVSRAAGGDLIAVHVVAADGLATDDLAEVERLRRLTTELGGEFQTVTGESRAEAILDYARGINATQVVVGVSRRSRWHEVLRPSVASAVADGSGDIDVHLVTHEEAGGGRRARAPGLLSPGRLALGWTLATVGIVVLSVILVATQESHQLSLEVQLYLALTIGCALAGGIWPALFCAVASSLVINWFFTEPRHTLTIDHPPNALALLVFVLVAIAVSSVVHVAARRTEQAIAAQRESEALASLSRDLLADPAPVPTLLNRARTALDMDVVVLACPPDGALDAPLHVRASTDPDLLPGSALPARNWTIDESLEDGARLLMAGPPPPAGTRRLLSAFAAHATVLLGRERLMAAERVASGLARDNAARTTLLAAVSHDLRTPLASIKAGVSMLRQPGVTLDASDEGELLESIEESADRLDALIGNLLDLSRLQTGAVRARRDVVDLGAAVEAAVQGIGAGGQPGSPEGIEVDLDDVAAVADLGLLDRLLANVVENAVRHSGGAPVRITAGAVGDRVEVRVADRGPGVPEPDKERIFAAFQRVGDTPKGEGVGLGLAVARGLTEVMGGSRTAEDTPGGGLTMVLSLPRADGIAP
ncbi:sensor histidine kinase KdpD [Intrasporangium sp. DVR]|uniref:sensor histidine kinase KdpD n=1 Tax=Intrasporangium sp. DVR TaxID=3127867 RepID=UPI00313A584E